MLHEVLEQVSHGVCDGLVWRSQAVIEGTEKTRCIAWQARPVLAWSAGERYKYRDEGWLYVSLH